MVVGKKYPTTDKEGRTADVYDIVIHPSELEIVELDSTMERRIYLCEQVLNLINEQYGEPLDRNFSQFKISTNYKAHSSLR